MYIFGPRDKMRITCLLISSLAFVGCRDHPAADVPVRRDLINERFETGAASWKFVLEEAAGKVQPGEGINGSACAVLTIASDHQIDCFSQALDPLDASQLEISAYVRASGDVEAQLRLECIDPSQFDNARNYGQLAEANSQVCATDGQWHLLTTKIEIPARAKYVQIFGCASGTNGVAYFDDFSVVRQ